MLCFSACVLSRLDRPLEHLAHLHRLSRQRHLTRFEPRKLQELLDHLHQPVDLLVGSREELLRGLRVLQRSALQRLDHRFDGGERSAQLVRDVGDEVTPDLFGPPHLREVVDDDERGPLPAADYWRRRHLQALVRPLHQKHAPPSILPARTQPLHDLLIRHHPRERVPHKLFLPTA